MKKNQDIVKNRDMTKNRNMGIKICLNMIVKNEAHVIKKTLENICSYIEFADYVISDTGSTDGTEEVIKSFFDGLGIRGKIFHDEWLDFGHNRTVALKHGRENSNADFLFIFDADDMIYGKMDMRMGDRDASFWRKDAYFLKFGGGLCYKRILLVDNKLEWKFEGVLHEYIVCVTKSLGAGEGIGLIEGEYFVDSGKTGARSKDPEKYVKDAAILEKAFIREGGTDIGVRYAFYCAQSYRDAGMKEKSIEWYKKRVELKGWNQEVYYSYYMIGQKYNELGEIEKAIFYWGLGIEADKERLECIYEIISYFRKTGKYAIAYGYFNMILNGRRDWWEVDLNDKLFSVRGIYLYLLKYEMTIVLFYVGELKLGLQYYKDLFRIAREYKCFGLDIGLGLLRNFPFYLGGEVFVGDLELNELYMNYVREIYLTFGGRIMDSDIKIIEYCVDKLVNWYNTDQRLGEIKNRLIERDRSGEGEVNVGRGVENDVSRNICCEIFLTITTCKRYDLFVKTVNSFLLCCKDIGAITGFLCVDDNSSAEDRKRMLMEYPFFKFYFKREEERGHLKSMNIIWGKVRESGAKYWIHLEDDWLFMKPEYYVGRSVGFLERHEREEIHQILFNKCYGETIGCYNLVGGVGVGRCDGEREIKGCVDRGVDRDVNRGVDRDLNYLLHVKDQTGLNGLNSAYWPHYSFRPSMCRVSAIIGLGDYSSSNTFFEMEYANKYWRAGFKSAYFNEICCLHIGRLTGDRNKDDGMRSKNAYELNEVKQFNEDAVSTINERERKSNEFIKIVDGYLYIEEYDFFGEDIEFINQESDNGKMSIKEMIKVANDLDECVAFNTLGYFKNDFMMDRLITNDFLKGCDRWGVKRGIYVRIDKLSEENRYYKIRGINTLDPEFLGDFEEDAIARTSKGFWKKTISFAEGNIIKINDIYDFWIEVDIVKYYNTLK
jgi:tetratricopeptide (TPR) repeat protein